MTTPMALVCGTEANEGNCYWFADAIDVKKVKEALS
jgi:hypothetical protein